jgi:outer membrane lipoprotein-sorting protein
MKKILTVLFLLMSALGFSLTPEEIINRMDDNETYNSVRMVGRMVTEDHFGSIESSFIVYAQGENELLMEFTSAQEAGQMVLRLENKIYLFFPDAEELILLQGAALRQSMMGSDISYEDMAGENSTLDDYDVTLLGEELVDGRETYKIQMVANKNDVAYAKQVVYVDQERFISLKTELYSLSGRQIKEIVTSEVEREGSNWLGKKTVITDLLKGNSSTTLYMEEIELNPRLDSDLFSVDRLTF